MTSERRGRRRGAAGFTLVELLVAMTLIGLISVALFGGLRFGARAWEAGNDRVESFAQLEVVQSLLRRELNLAVSLLGSDGRFSFEGEPERLLFTAPGPANFGLGGYYLFELASRDNGPRQDLMLRWRIYRAEQEVRLDDPATEERALLEGVESLEIRYFGDPEGQGEPDWEEKWEEQERPPGLVQIRVAFPQGDDRVWPVLTIAPRAGRAPQLP